MPREWSRSLKRWGEGGEIVRTLYIFVLIDFTARLMNAVYLSLRNPPISCHFWNSGDRRGGRALGLGSIVAMACRPSRYLP